MFKGQFRGFNHAEIHKSLAKFINKEIREYYHSPLQLAFEAGISERTLRKVRKGDPHVKYETYFAIITALAINRRRCNDEVFKELAKFVTGSIFICLSDERDL